MKKIKTESGLIVRKTGGGQDVVPGISISRISSHDIKPKLSPQQSSKPVINKVPNTINLNGFQLDFFSVQTKNYYHISILGLSCNPNLYAL